MIDYNIVNGKLVIEPTTLTVSAFNRIWESDPSKSKSKASNILTYVFTMCDERDRNPFRDVAYDKKESACKKNAFGNPDHKFTEEEIEMIEDAKAWFSYLNKKSVQRLSMAMDRKIDQMATFLDSNEVKTIADFEKQGDMMAKMDKIIKSKKETDKTVREELEKSRVKGEQQRSPLARGIFD